MIAGYTVFEAATTMLRSLNEPVGFWPSSLRYRFGAPIAAPRRAACTSGVSPSPRVRGGVASVTGRNRRYRSISRGRTGGRTFVPVITGSVIDGVERHVDAA